MVIRTAKGFVPPSGFIRGVRTALSWIKPADLEGISFVFLFSDVPATTPGQNRELDEAMRNGQLLFAAYNARSQAWPAHIVLIVQNLYKPIPLLLRHSPALAVWLAENIMHEVGHHLIAERKFRLRPSTELQGAETEEEFAERFAKSMSAELKGSRFYQFGKLLLRIAAEIDYFKGAHNWKKGNYEVAADQFYLGHQLNPDHKEANYWYWKAKVRATESAQSSDERHSGQRRTSPIAK